MRLFIYTIEKADLLMQVSETTSAFPAGTILGLVSVLGFLAAVTIGSIAWYNSKRPAGWEGRERPDYIPDTSNLRPGSKWLQDLLRGKQN